MHFFNRISLSTPESVELDFTLAGIGSRTLALFIDYNILGLVLAVFWTIWITFIIGSLSVLESSGTNYSGAPLWLFAIALLLNFVIYNGYFVFFEVMWQGQTPGKRATKIRVVRDDGRPVGLSQAALRSLLRLVDDILFIGAFFILFSKREKRIGDWAAGTIVVQEERGDRSKLMVSDAAKKLAAQLPDLADLSQLIPDDYAVIREYLMRRGKMAPKARTDKSLELARQLKAIVHLAEIPPTPPPIISWKRSFGVPGEGEGGGEG